MGTWAFLPHAHNAMGGRKNRSPPSEDYPLSIAWKYCRSTVIDITRSVMRLPPFRSARSAISEWWRAAPVRPTGRHAPSSPSVFFLIAVWQSFNITIRAVIGEEAPCSKWVEFGVRWFWGKLSTEKFELRVSWARGNLSSKWVELTDENRGIN